MNAPRVSIVVPVHNGARTLDLCLTGCLRQTHPNVDVTVVDDGSTDATPWIAKAHDVQYIRQEQAGPAAARNVGAASTTGDYIAFTDADCVPDSNWIAELLKAFDGDVAAAGGTYGNENSASWLSRMIHEEIQVRHANLEHEVDFLGSFNVMYRRDAFEAADGFDESFRTASGEDNDLAYRLQDNGGRLAFTRNALVSHHHPTGLVRYLRTQARHGYWRMKLYQKHPGRASGDRYAGIRDLAAAGLPVVCLIHLAATAITLNTPVIALPLAFASIAYVPAFLILHVDLPLRMAVRTRDAAMSLFWFVMVLRDFARAAGLVAGTWRFRIMKRAV